MVKKIKEFYRTKKPYFFASVIVILGVLLFAYNKTMAYMESPEFCGKCHIMSDVVASHASSSHAELECTECHMADTNAFGKLYFKATVGMRHLYYNTIATDEIPTVIHATKDSKETIQERCISCHEKTLGTTDHKAKDSCGDCHRGLPHGKANNKPTDLDKPPEPGALLNQKEGVY